MPGLRRPETGADALRPTLRARSPDETIDVFDGRSGTLRGTRSSVRRLSCCAFCGASGQYNLSDDDQDDDYWDQYRAECEDSGQDLRRLGDDRILSSGYECSHGDLLPIVVQTARHELLMLPLGGAGNVELGDVARGPAKPRARS